VIVLVPFALVEKVNLEGKKGQLKRFRKESKCLGRVLLL
jgi:hypothetical protein